MNRIKCFLHIHCWTQIDEEIKDLKSQFMEVSWECKYCPKRMKEFSSAIFYRKIVY
jgi:hypothetical protein